MRGSVVLLSIVLGAVGAFLWGDYHNQHVSVLTGGYVVKLGPVTAIGGFLGFIVGLALAAALGPRRPNGTR